MTATALAVTVVVAGACTGSGADKNGGGTASACTSPGVTQEAVKVGVLYPDTGPFSSSFQGFRGGITARFALENSRGGVHGREISTIWADDQASADSNRTEAQRLVEGEQVFSVVEASVAEGSSALYLEEQGVPVTGVGPSVAWTQHRNMFTWSSLLSQGAVTSAWGQIAHNLGGTRAAVLAVVGVPSSQELATTIAASMQREGIQTVYQNLQLDPLLSMTTLARAIASSKADIVTGVITPEIWAGLAPALRAQGAQITVPLFPNGYDKETLRSGGSAYAGMYVAQVTAPFELQLPAHQEFYAALTQYAPEVSTQQGQLALNGWLAADLMLRGLNAAGACPTRDGFIGALRSVLQYDAGGLVRPAANLTDYTLPSACLNLVRVDSSGQNFEVVGDAPICGQVQPVS
ncbi:hypothetical protein ACG83_36535 [Frankia sp. R43]|uniref:ABC transporter substrate-binding protein n=1 Tax=Frankia sp. R43 TaxID=269536 RepID=UPI0006C9F708|nr:ABC transporter substrate-binding protein [Frankia sp. R43]KPM50973.1 hypothetical protein ACG83_36535 [Frankia sp. R43]